MAELILNASSPYSLKQMGGKAASLHLLQGQNVPAWFVISPAAFNADYSISEQLTTALESALDKLPGQYFAVRSSAVDEDGSDFSFAGQMDSYLGVSKEQINAKIIQVWQSAFSERIKSYRQENQLGECIAPAVIVQSMVDASSAGVAFSVDPIGGYWDRAIVSSVWGLGSALVDGAVDSDLWHITRDNKVATKQLADKTLGRYLVDGKEQDQDHRSEKAQQASLSQKQAIAVARLCRECAQLRGRPQDIEWAFADDQLYLLQSRPITRLGRIADPEGVSNIWDNSNIAESYGGVTTPLTYSFALSIYAEVYREFCKLMGVPKQVISENSQTYNGLLGLMNGRIYYNLINWYRLLAVFPGFSVNRGFMEQMMGLQKEMGDELYALINKPKVGKTTAWLRLAKSLGGMFWNLATLKTQVKQFYIRLNKALAKPTIPLEQQRPDELVASYRDLENQLLLKWDAPLVNDFFAMIFFGLLSKKCKAWCNDKDGTLQNDLIGGDGQVISAQPAKRVKLMARMIATDKALAESFRTEAADKIVAKIRCNPELNSAYHDYLAIFSDRCLDELKLESDTLDDNPLPLLRAIGHFATREGANTNSNDSHDPALAARQQAEQKVEQALSDTPVKAFLFKLILKQARMRVRDRENLRFERTRLFGRVRRIMKQMGKRFACLGILDEPMDIFYLEKDEILNYVDGFCSCPDLRGMVSVRKKHFLQYQDLEPIADRFVTQGMVFMGNDFSKADTELSANLDAEKRQGTGCCPGIIKGRVKVVRDPRGVELPAGCILVAERTDPGWIMLFPAAAGLLVERGSLLSHSAIVARELGLPAVVSISGVTSWLKDGDLVEFNGSSGEVTLISEDVSNEHSSNTEAVLEKEETLNKEDNSPKDTAYEKEDL